MHVDRLLADLRLTFRSLGKNPGFAVVAALSLAIGIGANIAIYTIYSAIFQRDMGVTSPAELVDVYTKEPSDEFLSSSYPDYLDYREQTQHVLEDLMTYSLALAVLDQEDEGSEIVFGEEVSGNYFDVLGVKAFMGRTFILEEDDAVGAAPTAIISYTTWKNRYGSDSEIIGKALKLNGTPFTIIGVAPEEYTGMFPFYVDMWIPIHMHGYITAFGEVPVPEGELPAWMGLRGSRRLWIKGRLKAGATVDEARAALNTVGSRLAEAYPETNEGYTTSILPSEEVALVPFLDRPIRMFTIFLMALVGLVLLIACTNLAGMLLARATSRRREIGIRLAIGASRWQLVRQLLTESVVLALLGGVAGLLFAQWLIQILLAVQPPIPVPFNLKLGLNLNVLAFALVLSLSTGIIFGLLPALPSTRPDLVTSLKGAYAALEGRLRRFGLRSGLVVAQVTVSVLLLLCAGLFLRSLSNVNDVDTGYNLSQGAIATFDLGQRGYVEETGIQFFDELKHRLELQPGIESVAYADDLPLDASMSITTVWPQDTEVAFDQEEGVGVDISDVDGDYFRTMGIPIAAGRTFDSRDTPEGEQVMIVNETFARRYWPGESALGKRVWWTSDGNPHTIAGIARDGKYRSLGEEQRSFIYRPISRYYESFRTVVVRSNIDSREAVKVLRSEIQAMSPDLPMFQIMTIQEHEELMLFIPRLVAILVTGFGLFSLLLGTTGLYGVIAYDASRRTREVGVRIALGADRGNVLRMILWDGLKLVVVGLAAGLLITAAISSALRALLYGISPMDPVTFVAIPVLFLGVAIAATLNPARRASRVDPVEALRYE